LVGDVNWGIFRERSGNDRSSPNRKSEQCEFDSVLVAADNSDGLQISYCFEKGISIEIGFIEQSFHGTVDIARISQKIDDGLFIFGEIEVEDRCVRIVPNCESGLEKSGLASIDENVISVDGKSEECRVHVDDAHDICGGNSS